MTRARNAYGQRTEAWTDEDRIWSRYSGFDWYSWGLALVIAVPKKWDIWVSWVIGPWHGHIGCTEPLL